MDRQPVTIHYRRLDDVAGAFGATPLERAVRQAMTRQIDGGSPSEHWKQRAWMVPPDDEDTILMNLYYDGGHYFFGDLTLYSAGRMQALIESAGNAPTLDVEQQPAPVGKEYVNSLMYWFVASDHVLIIPSRALGAGQLERYLSWLLGEKTGVIGPTEHVILKAEFTAAEVGGNLQDIREIIIGNATPISTEVASSRIDQSDRYHQLTSRSSWSDRAVEILRAVMKNDADVRRLLEDVPDSAQLSVSVRIGYRDRSRQVTTAPMQRALRNLPEGEIIAKGRHGRLSGDDIRLSYPATISRNGSLLRHEDVLRAFEEAYRYFRENGKIQG